MDAFPHITPESLYAARIERRVSAGLSPDRPKAHWAVVPSREITDTGAGLLEAIEDAASYRAVLKTFRDIVAAGRDEFVQEFLDVLAIKGASIVGAPPASMDRASLR